MFLVWYHKAWQISEMLRAKHFVVTHVNFIMQWQKAQKIILKPDNKSLLDS